jgi:hypothetical protein
MNSASSANSCSKDTLTNRHARKWLCVLSIVVIAAVAGCGESSNEVSVEGRVTYRGEPLSKGSVTFFPSSGRPAAAALSEGGEYSLELLPGQYTVTVNVGTDLPPGFKEGDPIPPPKVVLPPEYTTRAKSSLTATVRQGDEQAINFELK